MRVVCAMQRTKAVKERSVNFISQKKKKKKKLHRGFKLTGKRIQRGNRQIHINQLEILAEPVQCHTSIGGGKESGRSAKKISTAAKVESFVQIYT